MLQGFEGEVPASEGYTFMIFTSRRWAVQAIAACNRGRFYRRR